jgi:hypothetical protein
MEDPDWRGDEMDDGGAGLSITDEQWQAAHDWFGAL